MTSIARSPRHGYRAQPNMGFNAMTFRFLTSPWTQRRWRFVWRYLRGETPWDSGVVPPEIVDWVAAHPQPGRALDLGCGTGTTSLYLAERGWHVTGVDFAPNAIARARRKAAQHRPQPGSASFVTGDVSRLDFLTGEHRINLVIDIGCLHGLTPDQRQRYAAHLARLAAPGATYLLYAFQPGQSPTGRAIGISPDGVRARFGPAFALVDVTLGEETTTPRPSAWYTLQRKTDT